MESDIRTLDQIIRYPKENLSFWIALASIGSVLLFVGIVSVGAALLLILFLFWTVHVLVRMNHRQQLGNALRISGSQFPHLAKLAAETAYKMSVSPLQIFIYQEDRINAYAFGWGDPHVVVLTSGCIESLEDHELRFVVGHEMGHVLLGHTRLGTLVGGMLGAPYVPFISTLLQPAFFWWRRCAEYSADRAGLIACGGLNSAISALIKLMVGPNLAKNVDVDQIIAQSAELSGKVDALFGEISGDHPFLVHRLRALVDFWETSECQNYMQNEHAESLFDIKEVLPVVVA